MTIVLAEKRCGRCGDTKPVAEFHRNRTRPDGVSWQCKSCANADVKARNDRRRAAIGDDAYRAEMRTLMQAYRGAGGKGVETNRAYMRARTAAITALIQRHKAEFDHLMTLARRGELEAAS